MTSRKKITAALGAAAVAASLFASAGPVSADFAETFRSYNDLIKKQASKPKPVDASRPDAVRVPILVYHSVMPHHVGQTPEQVLYDVSTAAFESQMRYLAKHGFSVISFGQMVDGIEGRAALPPKPVVITFDDGWQNQYRDAVPISL